MIMYKGVEYKIPPEIEKNIINFIGVNTER